MATVNVTPNDPDKDPYYISPHRSLLITVDELGDVLGISVRSVWRLLSAHRIPEPIRLAGSVRWRRSEVQAWVDAGCPELDNRKGRSSR